jgi:hypothetical protein
VTSRAEGAREDEEVGRLLGRPPAGDFQVIVRRSDGSPVVIRNDPHLRDGTPMPTMYWLVDPDLVAAVGRIESHGGVKRLEGLVDETQLAAAHAEYARLRRDLIVRTDRPAPEGGVGGTRTGVKCLHAHLANFIAGHSDPVGEIVAQEVTLPALVRGAP